MREQLNTHAYSIIVEAIGAHIGATEFDEIFSESNKEEVFSGFEVDNSDSDLDFSNISSVTSDQSDIKDDANEHLAKNRYGRNLPLKKSFILARFPWNTNLIYTQWKDKRDVAVLSTNCSHKKPHVTLSAHVCSARKTGKRH